MRLKANSYTSGIGSRESGIGRSAISYQLSAKGLWPRYANSLWATRTRSLKAGLSAEPTLRERPSRSAFE
ncbi:hypothetical protein [Moorena sp. SIO1G6]|uniref:hypothetical protein n=1 Tax=Moorena sp. SIO1G6 TaxID=2607840 RepID=UPI00257FA85C|nr:hypothetical protein [Moorena sp. SIO1G6]